MQFDFFGECVLNNFPLLVVEDFLVWSPVRDFAATPRSAVKRNAAGRKLTRENPVAMATRIRPRVSFESDEEDSRCDLSKKLMRRSSLEIVHKMEDEGISPVILFLERHQTGKFGVIG
jgi:hypothetical protein